MKVLSHPGNFNLGVFSRKQLDLLSCFKTFHLSSERLLEFWVSVRETQVCHPEWLQTIGNKEHLVERTCLGGHPLACDIPICFFPPFWTMGKLNWSWIYGNFPPAFIETWLSESDFDLDLALRGFGSPIHLDQVVTGHQWQKSWRRSAVFTQTKRYSNIIVVRERICTWDVEILLIILSPFYMPYKFTKLLHTWLYVHPWANA